MPYVSRCSRCNCELDDAEFFSWGTHCDLCWFQRDDDEGEDESDEPWCEDDDA